MAVTSIMYIIRAHIWKSSSNARKDEIVLITRRNVIELIQLCKQITILIEKAVLDRAIYIMPYPKRVSKPPSHFRESNNFLLAHANNNEQTCAKQRFDQKMTNSLCNFNIQSVPHIKIWYACRYWPMHVVNDVFMSILTYSCLFWHIHVSFVHIKIWYACCYWRIHVAIDVFMSLLTYSCHFWHTHVCFYMYSCQFAEIQASCSCLFWHMHVAIDEFMSLLTYPGLSWHAQDSFCM